MLQYIVSDWYTCSETYAVELPSVFEIFAIHLITLRNAQFLTVTRFEILCQDIDIVISFFVEYMTSSSVIAGCKNYYEIVGGIL